MKRAAIVGFGRFGELLAELGKESFDICVVESGPQRRTAAQEAGFDVVPLQTVGEADFVFLAVPISEIEATLKQIAPYVGEDQTVIDLCSVKVYPAKLMEQYLPESSLLATHPMFGPDSAKDGLNGLQVAICPLRISSDKLQEITTFWEKFGAITIQTTPEQHDQDVIYSQAFTYTLARVVLKMKLSKVAFRTRSFNRLLEIAELSANDSEQLFHDMLTYNPYFGDMKRQLVMNISETLAELHAIESKVL